MARRFLLATRSEGKLRELREIFSEFGLEAVDLTTLGIPETARENNLEEFETFEENALAKARYFFDLSGGMPTFGDDSGMCVDALNGEPGVYSSSDKSSTRRTTRSCLLACGRQERSRGHASPMPDVTSRSLRSRMPSAK